jgi:alpha-L-fucosidase
MFFSPPPRRKNKRRSRTVFAALLIIVVACSSREVRPPAPVGPLPTTAQLAWHQMEMNAFIHFTINTYTDKEWGFGNESPELFNPAEFDAGQWVRVMKAAGFKGVILTAKHHDGFCLWPSQYTAHSVKASPFMDGKGDVVGALAAAAKSNDLKFGIYLSPWDRNHSAYGTPVYVEYYRDQLRELFEAYGPVFEMWFDGANGGDGYYGGANEKRRIDGSTYYDWPGTIALVRDMEPNIIFFSDAGPGVRWVGNERGVAGETNWNTISIDTLFAGKGGIEKLLNTGHENGTSWVPAETDVSIRPGWFYHEKEDSLVKTPERLFEIYLSSVGRGSTLLLNIPPDRRGLIHERDVASLQGFRKLLDEAFAIDLARDATLTADQERGGSKFYSATMAGDGDPTTYWCTDDSVTTGEITIDLNEDTPVNYVVLQEYIALGQRVKEFELMAEENGRWRPVEKGTTIGYKRIIKTPALRTARLKVVIKDAKASPLISSISVY